MTESFWIEWGRAYLASNAIAVAMTLVAWRRPHFAKYAYAVMFFVAAVINARIAWVDPHSYLEFGKYAWPLYLGFINGIFVQVIRPLVLSIAFAQLVLALAFLGHGTTLKLACVGATIFLFAMIPLGLGSAFPFTFVASLGTYFIWRADHNVKR